MLPTLGKNIPPGQLKFHTIVSPKIRSKGTKLLNCLTSLERNLLQLLKISSGVFWEPFLVMRPIFRPCGSTHKKARRLGLTDLFVTSLPFIELHILYILHIAGVRSWCEKPHFLANYWHSSWNMNKLRNSAVVGPPPPPPQSLAIG